ncbi:MAG: transglutaminase domain-containing protein [Candidatus Omnitrophica bacterium]|nr:transglutaminase domain-containing protein [Candidatus Omnitrophota bacterium]
MVALAICWYFFLSGNTFKTGLILQAIPNPTASSEAIPIIDSWKGIYFNNSKIGFSNTQIKKLAVTEPSAYHIKTEMHMLLGMLGQYRETAIKASTYLHTDLSLHMFDLGIYSANHKMYIRGETTDGDILELKIVTGESVLKKRINMQHNIIPSPALAAFLSIQKFNIHDRIVVPVFDPFILHTDHMTVTFTGTERLKLHGIVFNTLVAETEFRGIKTRSWIADTGEVVKETTPFGWVMVVESPQEATRLISDKAQMPDILSQVSIPSNRPLQHPQDIAFLKALLKNIPGDMFDLITQRQTAQKQEEGLWIIAVQKENGEEIAKNSLPVHQISDITPLMPTYFIQSNDPVIHKLANEIRQNDDDAWQIVLKLHEWIYKNIRKTPTLSVPSSLDVLRTREGDCNEHTVLFTALSRACGIPTKMCAGIVYYQGDFYYHSWPKVFVGRWVDVDPTLGQVICDGTHIQLIEGDLLQQIQLASILGRIEVEILEAR